MILTQVHVSIDAPQRADPQFETDVSAGNFLYLNNDLDIFRVGNLNANNTLS
jgi:hypothetical protein